MAEKQAPQAQDILNLYMQYVLENGERPKSIFKFSKENHFQESEFYQFYSSFESLEKAVFLSFLENTKDLLSKDEEYAGFDPRNKLLSFYFTFFESLTANRSYVAYALKAHKNKHQLSDLRKGFKEYVRSLNIKPLSSGSNKAEQAKNKIVEEGAWLQLLITIKFWLEDTSARFERTDVFIEKSIKATFDLVDAEALTSLLDLGKFLIKEKL